MYYHSDVLRILVVNVFFKLFKKAANDSMQKQKLTDYFALRVPIISVIRNGSEVLKQCFK